LSVGFCLSRTLLIASKNFAKNGKRFRGAKWNYRKVAFGGAYFADQN
jgi:hypothetical protein